MTPEQQRIAIAEACGMLDEYTSNRLHAHPELISDHPYSVPDYLTDLNAMHEAEKVLTPEQFDTYYQQVWEIVGKQRNVVHVTAAQRAEAFLRTLNLFI